MHRNQFFTDANPSGDASELFPFGLVEDERGVVGAWWITPDARRSPDGAIVLHAAGIRGLVRTKKGNPRGFFGKKYIDLIPSCNKLIVARQSALQLAESHLWEVKLGIEVPYRTPHFSDMLFAVGIQEPRWLPDLRINARGRVRSYAQIFPHRLAMTCGEGDESVEIYRHADKLFAALARPFVETLDPEALAYVSSYELPDYASKCSWLTDDVWSGIDATFTPGAPLRRLLRAVPQHGDRLLSHWKLDRSSFDGSDVEVLSVACRHPYPDDEREAASDLMAGKFLEHATTISAACGASGLAPMPAYPASESEGFPPTKQSEMLRIMQGLPLDWMPCDADQWKALADLSGPLCEALRRVDSPSNPVLFNIKGRWVEFGKRLEKFCARVGLEYAVKDVGDMTDAFYRQLILPSITREVVDENLLQIGCYLRLARLITDGRSLPRLLEMSRRWHGMQPLIDARLAALSPELEIASHWPAGLPNWSFDDIDVVVLTSKAMLVDEGRYGVNVDGSKGLSHCVGGYSETCRAGKSRIVSLRRRLTGGGFERLSTAELVDIRRGIGFQVIEHRGDSNRPSPDESQRALQAYQATCRREELFVDWNGLTPLPSINSVEALCGYDWRKPGNIEEAIAIWSPCLPGHVRRMTPREIAAKALEGYDLPCQ